jgi:hypothetical protein
VLSFSFSFCIFGYFPRSIYDLIEKIGSYDIRVQLVPVLIKADAFFHALNMQHVF